jgi:predicted ArsR family transcriptional regulator
VRAVTGSPAVETEETATGRDERESATFSAAVEAVTSAFGDSTRREIYLVARTSNGVTASEIAQRFALHPNVARHHLDKLASGGYLEVYIDHVSPGAGRPSKRYRPTTRATEVPMPPRPDELMGSLLARALAQLEPHVAERLAEEVGQEYGRSLAAQMSPGDPARSRRAAMAAVADALTAHGFAAHVENRETSTSIVRGNCPFGELAADQPVLCAVDRGMVQGLLAGLCGDGVPVHFSSRARGDDACTSITA